MIPDFDKKYKQIPLKGHNNHFKKQLIYKGIEKDFYKYILDLDIPYISIHKDGDIIVAIDIDGGPFMGIGFNVLNKLTLDHITANPLILYFKEL